MHVNKVFDVLKKDKLFLKMSKCEFGKNYLVYLGNIVGGGELKIDPSKVEVILNWPNPNTFTEVRSFLGATQCWLCMKITLNNMHMIVIFNMCMKA